MPPKCILLYGNSLGAAVATQLAALHPGTRLELKKITTGHSRRNLGFWRLARLIDGDGETSGPLAISTPSIETPSAVVNANEVVLGNCAKPDSLFAKIKTGLRNSKYNESISIYVKTRYQVTLRQQGLLL